MDNISELERLISIRIMQEDTEAIFSANCNNKLDTPW